MRIFLFIFAALVAAGGTGFYLFRALSAQPQQVETTVVEAPKGQEVFVPASALAAGTILRPENLGRVEIPNKAVTDEMIVADEAGNKFVEGSVARQALPAGVPIARSAIVHAGERGFLAAVLPKGKRAISIPVTEISGVSGLVLPGDRVDIILTYSVNGQLIDAQRSIRASETLLTNIRVLALDRRLNGNNRIEDASGNVVEAPMARTATIEVTPEQAEMVTLARELGGLSLVLNSVRDGGEEQVASADDADAAGTSMTEPLGLGESAARTGMLNLAARPMTIDSDVTSLLRRDATGSTGDSDGSLSFESPIPMQDRMSRVQVVRGNESRAVSRGDIEDASASDVSPDSSAAVTAE